MMSHRVKAINDDLRMLGDDYRLGRIAREEYRHRRRRLLRPVDTTSRTARKPLIPRFRRKRRSMSRCWRPRTGLQEMIARLGSMTTGRRLAAFGMAALLFALLAFWLLHDPDGTSSTTISSAEAGSGETAALERWRHRFVDNNRWDAPSIEAFLQTWRAADAGTRKMAEERPAIARLREQITYNQRTSMLLDDSARGSGRLNRQRYGNSKWELGVR